MEATDFLDVILLLLVLAKAMPLPVDPAPIAATILPIAVVKKQALAKPIAGFLKQTEPARQTKTDNKKAKKPN